MQVISGRYLKAGVQKQSSAASHSTVALESLFQMRAELLPLTTNQKTNQQIMSYTMQTGICYNNGTTFLIQFIILNILAFLERYILF